MIITIDNITIRNFKGFRFYQATFDPQVTSIYGDNGLGKTTIADAILWCLFGKDTQNRQQFDIKYHDFNGNTEKNIEVSVTLQLHLSSNHHTIERKLKERWSKERGTTTEYLKGHVTEYYVDGQPYTQTDFKAFMAKIMDERTFRAVTSPTFFTSLDWKEQRQFLSQMVGDITNEEIAANNPEYSPLLKQLSSESIDSIIKSIGYKIKECKSKLSEIPVSIVALNNAMPEEPQTLPNDKEIAEARLVQLRQQLNQLLSGNTSNIRRDELNRKINFAQKRLNEMQSSASNIAMREREQYEKSKQEFSARQAGLQTQISTHKQNIEAKTALISRTRKRIEECDVETERLRAEWQEKVNCKFQELTEEQKYCPTCGQPLPEESIAELRNRAYERFQKQRNESKETITRNVAEVNRTKKESMELIAQFESEIAESDKQMADLSTQLSQLNFETVNPRSYDEILTANDNYTKVSAELETLKAELANVSDTPVDQEQIEKIKCEIQTLEEELQQIQRSEVIEAERRRIQQLIAEKEKERTDCSQRLADLEHEEDIARSFSNRADTLLEEKVNRHFNLVEWRMFRQNINGNREPYCECYVDGTAYHDGLNSAKRINAGLDIINTLCSIYQLHAPIVMDNCESTNKILPTVSQQIRLYVSNDKKLTIK